MSNPSGIQPIEFKVLIKPHDVDEVTAGGIIMPEQAKEKEQHAQMQGEIVALSPLAFSYDESDDQDWKPRVGDRVLFARYAGATVKGKDGVEYRIASDKDVAAVLS